MLLEASRKFLTYILIKVVFFLNYLIKILGFLLSYRKPKLLKNAITF